MRQYYLYLCLCLTLLTQAGCTALTVVASVPGALYGVLADEFSGEEESFPYNTRAVLAALQQSLKTMDLNVDVLEIQPRGGYGIAFNNDKLDGKITLIMQTPQLTTVYVEVKSLVRQDSIERAIIQVLGTTLPQLDQGAHIDLEYYHILRSKMSFNSKRLGWVRPGSTVEAMEMNRNGWLKLAMPSGKAAYFNNQQSNNRQTYTMEQYNDNE